MREEVEPMTELLVRLITILDVTGIKAFLPEPARGAGRPPENRWERRAQVYSEATFSRAFTECAQGDLPDRMRAALINRALGGRIIGAIARDATEIEAREKPVEKRQERRSAATIRKCSAAKQTRTPANRRRTIQRMAKAGTNAPRASNDSKRQPDGRGPPYRLRCRRQEKQQGLQGDLGRL